jgi:hypothetical protein
MATSADASPRAPVAAASTAAPAAPAGRDEHKRANLWSVSPTRLLPRLSGALDALIAGGVAGYDRGSLIALHLHPDEAVTGGTAAVTLPVDITCPDCRAGARAACSRCAGRSLVRTPFIAWLTIPRQVTDGAILAASIELPDAIGVVRFRIVIDQPT